MKHFNFYILVLLCCGIYGFAQPSTCTNKGELYLDGSNFVGCTTVNNYNIRPIPEKNPYTALPYTVIEEDGDMQYVPDAGGVLYRQGTDLYKVANEGFVPVTLPYLSSYNYPDRLHELGKIIYYPYDGHFYEGVADGKWVQIDNPIYLEILPENLFLDYPAGNFTYTINSEVNWAIANFNNYPGYTFTPTTGTLNGTSVMAYPANTTIANTVRTFRIREVNNIITKNFTVTQYYKPYFAYTNIKDVYGKEQSGTIPSSYQKKVNPGPERFFLWASSNWNFRVRVKYNNAPLPQGYTNTDAVNGDYDYEFQGKGELWAYEYQLKENRTGADRAVGLEISYKRMDGSWDPWEDLNVKNTDNTNITQAYVHTTDYAARKWSTKFAGATAESQDVGYVYPNSYYGSQFGTETTNIDNNHTLVTSYSETGVGNEAGTWKLPETSDLQDLKTAGFVPNRPFVYTGATSGLGSSLAANATYNNWNAAKTAFLDTTVATANKLGYGNAFYLYDKTGALIMMPRNGMLLNGSRDTNLRIIGKVIAPPSSSSSTTNDNYYFGYVYCVSPGGGRTYSEPTRYMSSTQTTSSYSGKHNGVTIYNTIGGVTDNYYNNTSNNTWQEAQCRECTPSPECGSSSPVVIGPWAPFTCSAWVNCGNSWGGSSSSVWSVRLVHD